MHSTRVVAPDIERVARQFVQRLAAQFEITGAYVFGSRARGDAQPESDTDIAVLLRGHPGRRVDEAVKMADIAYDLMLETGVRIEALPLWQSEWEHPETFNNPALIENIRHDGVAL
ncbi:MAG: nucleotidyltransferase [Betaproteobacteria bacterium HGW-Betaproteobacteria-12]|nr:MAG: nucleotidyltransferase [Betaproteobacteria bacterium HGW-Betaproteobacteria-12]